MNYNFEYLLNKYYEYIEIKLKEQSIISIHSRFNNYIIPFFKNYNVNEITALDYLKWQEYIESKKFRYGYKKSLHYAMVGFYSYLMVFYNIKNNIPRQVGNFKNNEIIKEMNFWTIEEFQKFNNSFEKQDFIYKCFFILLFYTGIREGEALALTFNDVDFSNNSIYINKTISKEYYNGKKIITNTKTRESIRHIKLDKYTFDQLKKLKKIYLKKYIDFNDNFFVFGGNKSMSITNINRRKLKYCKKANVKVIRIHDFRHSHATLLLKENIPIIEISRRLGHSDINTTIKTYTHLNILYEKKALDALNWFYNK